MTRRSAVYAVCSISTDISESKKNIEMKEELLRQKEYQKVRSVMKN
ncbi:MAG: hypothetical protein IPL69_20655 [Saprospiraceae bacterium]|nr:hypothetical protein [Candidatus Brachybacter algidus]